MDTNNLQRLTEAFLLAQQRLAESQERLNDAMADFSAKNADFVLASEALQKKRKALLAPTDRDIVRNYISIIGDKEFGCEDLVCGTGIVTRKCKAAIFHFIKKGFIVRVGTGANCSAVYRKSSK